MERCLQHIQFLGHHQTFFPMSQPLCSKSWNFLVYHTYLEGYFGEYTQRSKNSKIHKTDLFKKIDYKSLINFRQQGGNAGSCRNLQCRHVNNIVNAIIANLIDWTTFNNYAMKNVHIFQDVEDLVMFYKFLIDKSLI